LSANGSFDLAANDQAERNPSFRAGDSGQPFDLEAIEKGLEEIGRDLLQSDELKNAAEAMIGKDLPLAAEELRRVGGQMGADTPAAAREMLESFQRASKNATPGLEQLAKAMTDISEGLKNLDDSAVQEAVEKVAEELERLEGEMLVHETGGQQIARGMQSMPGEPASQIRQAGEAPQARSDSMGLGTSSSRGGGQAELPETTLDAKIELDIQLQQAGLNGLQDFSTTPPVDLEEASKQERSKLDYRNIASELTPAQKDVLNRNTIPWEYRPLIKRYFQAIRPTGNK
jgi:hypothetical protein